MGSINENNRGQKSCDTAPLILWDCPFNFEVETFLVYVHFWSISTVNGAF